MDAPTETAAAAAPAEKPKSKLDPGRLSRKAVCTGLIDLFDAGVGQGSAAGLSVAHTALMDAAKLHGLTEKKSDGQTQRWEVFLDRVAARHVALDSGGPVED
jgi:hypothetical protein